MGGGKSWVFTSTSPKPPILHSTLSLPTIPSHPAPDLWHVSSAACKQLAPSPWQWGLGALHWP